MTPLLIWLNENVGFAFVFSPWHGIQASLNPLLIWLNENVDLVLGFRQYGVYIPVSFQHI
ncbi:MAG: hypothetical protein PUD52_10400 [Prevotella sp.]|nr:hypothetical protein [Prevotella sp.]